MTKQTEALKLGLEALKKCHYYMIDAGLPNQSLLNEAFTAATVIREALAEQPAQQEFVSPGGGYVPAIPAQQRPIKTFHDGKAWPVQEPAQQDSTCNNALRIQGKAYPRTCKKCGLGPCVELAQQALDKKAENARELGLDYEPAQQEPVAWRTFDGEGGYEYRSYEMNEQYAQEWEQRNPKHKGWVEPLYTSPPAQPQQELVKVGRIADNIKGMVLRQEVMLYTDDYLPIGTAIYTSPPAQRTWVGLTAQETASIAECVYGSAHHDDITFATEIQIKLKEKNTP